ncbi:hypothetical protein OC835_000105 [Tilletia horrida]|nr:hypothetical protein OC835_000105 [Tilletia horrida]
MPHASVIVPSVIGAAAAAAAFEVSVFRPWRERNAPQGLHVFLGQELEKFGRTAEEFGRHLGQQADELGGRVRDEFRRVGQDVQHAAGELRQGFVELTQGNNQTGGSSSGSGGRRLGGEGSKHGDDDDSRDEHRGLMRRNDSWDETSKTSAIDRPMYAPAETDYDPDDEQTLASLQQLHHRRRQVHGSALARDDADNVTLREVTSAGGGSSSARGTSGPAVGSLIEDEDEGTAAFRAHRSLLGEVGAGNRATNTIFDFEDFGSARDAFGFEEVHSPHHALGSPSIAASDIGGDDFFSSVGGEYNGADADAVHLSDLDVSTLSLSGKDKDIKALPPAPASEASGPVAKGSTSSTGSDDGWQRASRSAAPSLCESDGELVNASVPASEAGESFGRTVSEGGWIDLAPNSPDSLSPPSSPRSGQRQIQP